MPLLDLSRKYLKHSKKSEKRYENRKNVEKYYKKSISESDYEKYDRKKYKKNTCKDLNSRHKMIELSDRCQKKEDRFREKVYRSIKKERSRSKELNHRNYEKIDKIEKSQRKRKTLKWEEELYGKEEKKIKYDLLHSVKKSNEIDYKLEKIKNDSINKDQCFDERNIDNLKSSNDFYNSKEKKLINLNNSIIEFKNRSNLNEKINKNDLNNFDNTKSIFLSDENDLEKLPIIKLNNNQNGVSVSNIGRVSYIVIDYEHGEKTVDTKVVYKNKIKSNISNHEDIISLVHSQSITNENVEHEKLMKSNNDIMALAKLIVEVPQKIKPVENLIVNIQTFQRNWKLIKLDIPKQINYTAENVNILKCAKNDPRLQHLRESHQSN